MYKLDRSSQTPFVIYLISFLFISHEQAMRRPKEEKERGWILGAAVLY